MAVKTLFDAIDSAPLLSWDDEAMTASGPAGITAYVWRSAVSGKLVLSVDAPAAWLSRTRVVDLAHAKAAAETLAREVLAR